MTLPTPVTPTTPPQAPAAKPAPTQFNLPARILHWLMSAMIFAMLFIGVIMVSSVAYYGSMVAIHRPLGIAILLLVIVRYLNRRMSTLPPFLKTMPPIEQRLSGWGERLLYALMFILPLVGWGMLSAARYPIVMFDGIHLPPILPHSPPLASVLRKAHTILAYLLFFTVLGHLAGVLFHQLVIQDGILNRMLPWTIKPKPASAPDPQS